MRFDNKQFEDGVATSMSTLDKLKKSLNLDGAAKGLDGLSDAAKKCDMSTLSRSVEAVQTKFSAIQPIFDQIAKDAWECQRRFEIVRKRRRNFVVFRRGGG